MIVTKFEDSLPSNNLEGEIVEPAFLIAAQGFDTCSLATVSAHLAHKITRDIRDLRSHVQRISLFIKQQQEKASYSALVDLFLVLGDNGLALRKRMLINVRTLLSEHELNTLRQSLSSGLTSEVRLPITEQALLTKGLASPHREFIQENTIETIVAMSPVEEAMSYIEHGQLEQAQATLQKAIITNPHQLELHYDLLEIFQKTADKEQFLSSYKQLLEQAILLPPQWREMAQKFGVETR